MSSPQSVPLPAPALLATLQRETGFTPYGTPIGNLTLGRGMITGMAAHIALIENRIASGSLGVKECDKLAHLFRIVALEKRPLILYLDSAGARLSEGLAALGAFRWMFREALSMVRRGAPVSVCLGANCFGGASMLAALAGTNVVLHN